MLGTGHSAAFILDFRKRIARQGAIDPAARNLRLSLQDCFGKQPVETANLYVAVPSMVTAGGAVLLLAGLWTPLAGILVAVLELWIAFLRPTDSWASVIAAAVALGLSLLGPGAWSIDARVYGRKRMSIHDR